MDSNRANRRNEAIATISGLGVTAPSPAHETFSVRGTCAGLFEFAVLNVESDKEVLQWTL